MAIIQISSIGESSYRKCHKRTYRAPLLHFKAPPFATWLGMGFIYDGVTGIYAGPTPPATTDVRAGVPYVNGAMTGTLDLPDTSNVKAGVTFDGASKAGTYAPDLPSANDLKINVTCGVDDPGGPVTGTYAGEPLYPPQCVHSGLAPLPQRLEVSLA